MRRVRDYWRFKKYPGAVTEPKMVKYGHMPQILEIQKVAPRFLQVKVGKL